MKTMGKVINLKTAKILVTGGSGSLGRNVIKILAGKGARNIISVSRDENLIKDASIEVGSSAVTFKLGDITDSHFISRIIADIDIVFNTAALKHVSLAEQNPREAYRINVSGLLNLLDNSQGVKRFIHVSSDKAIGVMNCYGATKLLGEYLVRETNNFYDSNKYIIVRCPNFLASRGSVLDMWSKQVKKDNKITVTDPGMTRYFITLEDAANFVVDTGLKDNINPEKIYYPLKYTKKFLLSDLAAVFVDLFGSGKTKILRTGALPGEKKHEDYIQDVELCSKDELKKMLSKYSF